MVVAEPDTAAPRNRGASSPPTQPTPSAPERPSRPISRQSVPVIVLADVNEHPKISGRVFGPVSPSTRLAEITTLRMRQDKRKFASPRYFVKRTRAAGHCSGYPFWEWVPSYQTLASLGCFDDSKEIYLVYIVEGMGDRFIIGLHKTIRAESEKAITFKLNGSLVRDEVTRRLGNTSDHCIKSFDYDYRVGHLRLKEEHFTSRTTALYIETE